MSVHVHGGTMSGGVTPVCDECGVSLCWDVSRTEYLEAKAFWDSWRCQDCNGSRLSAHGWRLENGREALPAAVQAAIAAFEEMHPDLDRPETADDRSLELSAAFAALLSASGVEARTVVVADVHGTPHHGVAVGAFTVDWNAVRHDCDAPAPLVFRTALGWPIEPAPKRNVAEMIADLDEDQLEALVARIAARRRAA